MTQAHQAELEAERRNTALYVHLWHQERADNQRMREVLDSVHVLLQQGLEQLAALRAASDRVT